MINTEQYKEKLLEEKALLERELGSLGHKNPDNKKDWVADPENEDEGPRETADRNLVADRLEDYEERDNVTETLEERLVNVDSALSRIEDGTYGTCEVCNSEIEEDRLGANPAAKTCKAHLNG